jgi:hypothetical protein
VYSESGVQSDRFLVKSAALVLISLAAPSSPAVEALHKIEELNYYEWTAVAAVVVAGTSLGENGRHLEFRAKTVLRGAVEEGSTIRIDLKHANRNRRRSDYPFALKMPAQNDFIVVLESPHATKDGGQAFRMARGVRSVRELPLEAQQGLLEAVAMFVEIQDHKDDRATWRRMGQLLEQTNPVAIRTALEQMAKFNRGQLDHLFSIRPLLDHPDPSIRRNAAKVAGLIVRRHAGAEVPEEGELMAELIGVARRDEIVEPRVAATEALAAFGAARVLAILEEIAATDPEQDVRYAAERILLEYRQEQEIESARPRLAGDSH